MGADGDEFAAEWQRARAIGRRRQLYSALATVAGVITALAVVALWFCLTGFPMTAASSWAVDFMGPVALGTMSFLGTRHLILGEKAKGARLSGATKPDMRVRPLAYIPSGRRSTKRDLLASPQAHIAPRLWPSRNPQSVGLFGLGAAILLHFMPVIGYLVALPLYPFAALSAVTNMEGGASTQQFAQSARWVATALARHVRRAFASHIRIALFRSFRTSLQDNTSRILKPILGRFGEVVTLWCSGLEVQDGFEGAMMSPDEYVQAADENWAEVVRSLIAASDYAVLDLTEDRAHVSDELAWSIEHLTGARCLVVCHRSRNDLPAVPDGVVVVRFSDGWIQWQCLFVRTAWWFATRAWPKR